MRIRAAGPVRSFALAKNPERVVKVRQGEEAGPITACYDWVRLRGMGIKPTTSTVAIQRSFPLLIFLCFFFAGKNSILDPTADITVTFSESRASGPNPPHESRRALWGVTCDLPALDWIRAAVTRMRLNHITVISGAADVLSLRLPPAAHHPCVHHGREPLCSEGPGPILKKWTGPHESLDWKPIDF